jgi:hypothetical protein
MYEAAASRTKILFIENFFEKVSRWSKSKIITKIVYSKYIN